MRAARAPARVEKQPSSRWTRLAAVARERASEQLAKAATASDSEVAGPHRQQEAYLIGLAEVYEQRAKAV